MEGVEGATLASTDIILAGSVGTAINELDSYGGPTLTHLLVAGSPAIDAGNNSLIPTGITTDQRGENFPRMLSSDPLDIIPMLPIATIAFDWAVAGWEAKQLNDFSGMADKFTTAFWAIIEPDPGRCNIRLFACRDTFLPVLRAVQDTTWF
ncbi:hypothetical protein CCP4SC76_4750012 [Gammaproteobacteria bacterium]